MATVPLTATVKLPTLRLKLNIRRGWRVRVWLTARILTVAGWVYGRPIDVTYDGPEVTFDR